MQLFIPHPFPFFVGLKPFRPGLLRLFQGHGMQDKRVTEVLNEMDVVWVNGPDRKG